MNAYLPSEPALIGVVLIEAAVVLVIGFGITRIRFSKPARIAAWTLLVVSLVGIERTVSDEPAGFRMLAIIAALLLPMKVIVSVEDRIARRRQLKPLSWFLFAAGWLGMRPVLFADVPGSRVSGSQDLAWLGTKRLLAGFFFLAVARFVWLLPTDVYSVVVRRVAATAFLLPGVSLVLHFGLLNYLAAFWRLWGANCKPLFRAPLLSTNLAEFWGRRWNLAFSEMTAIGLHRPLRRVVGERAATAVAFLFSGLLHELAISVPVRAGFGLPTLYFALHAIAMQIERALERQGRPIDGSVWRGRLWTVGWLVLPLPILFHPPFLKGCLWPLIGME